MPLRNRRAIGRRTRRRCPGSSWLAAAVCLATWGLPREGGAQATFTPLGDLPGGAFESIAYSISADGKTIVGKASSASGSEAFRWTQDGGMESLGIPDSEARGVSGDGSVVVGTRNLGTSLSEAFRWDDGTVTVLRGTLTEPLPCPPEPCEVPLPSSAYGVSADGSTVTGSALTSSFDSRSYPIAWRGDDVVLPFGISIGPFAAVLAANPDGSVLVGTGIDSDPAAFRYADGSVDFLASHFHSTAEAVSADGKVVVGFSIAEGGGPGEVAGAYRWTETGGAQSLSPLGWAYGVSADGSIVVGTGDGAAQMWTADTHRLRDIREALVSNGAANAFAGWSEAVARAISADGTAIVGDGINPSGQREGWLAVLPKLDCELVGVGATITGFGVLPGGDFGSAAEAASADGSVAIGTSGTWGYTPEAFRWTAASGLVGLGRLEGRDSSTASDVSADGSVVVGESGGEAFRWTPAGGMQGLGDLPEGRFGSRAAGVSADGSVVVGTGNAATGTEAFRWTPMGAMVGLGFLPGGTDSTAWDISIDGSVVVGDGGSTEGGQAFRWTAEGGMQGLGDLPGGGFRSTARGVSADGSIVVGESDSGWGFGQAFRWTAASGMVGFGRCSGAVDVSADGSLIVGNAVIGRCQGYEPAEAFVWTAKCGVRPLLEVLAAGGADVSRWGTFPFEARGISADGRTIVGSGWSADGDEAWLAVLPLPLPPTECSDGLDNDGDGATDFPADDGCISAEARSEIRVDLDFDGLVDEGDRAALAAAFGHAEGDPAYLPEGDFDGDGRITIVDYQRWLALYEQALAARPLASGCGLLGIEPFAAVLAARAMRRRKP